MAGALADLFGMSVCEGCATTQISTSMIGRGMEMCANSDGQMVPYKDIRVNNKPAVQGSVCSCSTVYEPVAG